MIKNQLKLLFSNRIAFFAIIAAPLLLTYLFSLGSSKTSLYINDSDNSPFSKQLIKMVEKHDDVVVVKLSIENLKKDVGNNSIPMGFVINKGFGHKLANGKLDLKIFQNYNTGDGAMLKQIVLSEVNTLKKITVDSKLISDKLNISSKAISKKLFERLNDTKKVSIKDLPLRKGQGTQNSTSNKLIGFLVMFIWFIVIQGFRPLIGEKENNTISRVLSTPTNYNKYLVSKTIATYVFGLIAISIVLIAGKYFFNITLAKNLFAESLAFAVYLFSLLGIVLLFVPFIKKQQSFTVFGAVIMALTGILGGCFFPIDEITSGTMSFISKLTPESYAIKAISDVTLNNAPISSILPSLIVLGAIGVASLIISYFIINQKIKAEKAY